MSDIFVEFGEDEVAIPDETGIVTEKPKRAAKGVRKARSATPAARAINRENAQRLAREFNIAINEDDTLARDGFPGFKIIKPQQNVWCFYPKSATSTPRRPGDFDRNVRKMIFYKGDVEFKLTRACGGMRELIFVFAAYFKIPQGPTSIYHNLEYVEFSLPDAVDQLEGFAEFYKNLTGLTVKQSYDAVNNIEQSREEMVEEVPGWGDFS